MGFGTVAANVIMFISVMLLASGVLVVMNIYVQETRISLQTQKDRVVDEIRTDVKIQSVTYNSTSNEGISYVINRGSTDLRIAGVDILLDGIRVSRDNRTITIESDTQISADAVWSPSEVIRIDFTQDLSSGRKAFRVITENGVRDEEGFDA